MRFTVSLDSHDCVGGKKAVYEVAFLHRSVLPHESMYHWSKLSSKKWEDAWEERFYGNVNAVIQEVKGGKSIRVQVYCETEAEAMAIKEQFGGSVREVKSATWAEPQDLTKKPLLIRDQLVLTQTVESDELAALKEQYADRAVLNIPAEMAFGTGDHPTTSNCLRTLADFAKKQKEAWTMVDAGCGTGVIAMAAYALGAEQVEAFDFDPKAVEVTEKNLALNEAQEVKAYVEDVFNWSPQEPFDFVAANLFSTILQKAFPILKAALKPEGTIVISGILATQWEETEAAAKQAGLLFPEVKPKGKWVTAVGHHA